MTITLQTGMIIIHARFSRIKSGTGYMTFRKKLFIHEIYYLFEQ